MTAEEYAEKVYKTDYHFSHPYIKKLIAEAFVAGEENQRRNSVAEISDEAIDLMVGLSLGWIDYTTKHPGTYVGEPGRKRFIKERWREIANVQVDK